jgi:hypothetical protein
VVTVLANQIAPGLIDRYLARTGYKSQLSDTREPADAPDNLFEPVPGSFGAHGRFDDRNPRTRSWEMDISRHRGAFWAAVAALTLGAAAGAHLVARRLDV